MFQTRMPGELLCPTLMAQQGQVREFYHDAFITTPREDHTET